MFFWGTIVVIGVAFLVTVTTIAAHLWEQTYGDVGQDQSAGVRTGKDAVGGRRRMRATNEEIRQLLEEARALAEKPVPRTLSETAKEDLLNHKQLLATLAQKLHSVEPMPLRLRKAANDCDNLAESYQGQRQE